MLYVLPANEAPLRLTLNITVLASIEPQRPSQSNSRGSTAVALPFSADVLTAEAVLASAGDSTVPPVRLLPVLVAKPDAQTAPVARPVAPNASHAVRPRFAMREEVSLDTAPLPFLKRAVS